MHTRERGVKKVCDVKPQIFFDLSTDFSIVKIYF